MENKSNSQRFSGKQRKDRGDRFGTIVGMVLQLKGGLGFQKQKFPRKITVF